MKHLATITRAPALPATAIEIPEDVIRRVQDVDFVQLAVRLLPDVIELISSGEKQK